MCGIVSIFNIQEQTPELRQQALRMSQKIRHRGPDWSGIYCGGSAILAHERLSIVDPESGRQPLFAPDKKQVLAVNGEIYNHQDIRARFTGKYQYQTGSDCEVILSLYREMRADSDFDTLIYKGEDALHARITKMLEELNGIFAFALYDAERDEFLIARDPIGVIPLYISYDKDGKVLVASELKALEGQCDHYEPFLPGHYYYSKNPGMKRYYTRDWFEYAAMQKKYQIDDTQKAEAQLKDAEPQEEAAVKEIHDALEASVKRQLMSDVPYGVLLSGGLDSSVISAIAEKYSSTRVENGGETKAYWPRLHSFAVGLKGAPDLAKARLVAEHIGTVHHEINYTIQEGLDAIRDVIYFIETYDVTTVRASTPMYLGRDKKIKWIFSSPEGWRDGWKEKLLTPVKDGKPIACHGSTCEGDFDYTWTQHTAFRIDEKSDKHVIYVTAFDNGDARGMDQPALAEMKYSRAVVYRIDQDKKTIEQVWEYGKERGFPWYSPVTSLTKYCADKDSIMVYSATAGMGRRPSELKPGEKAGSASPFIEEFKWGETEPAVEIQLIDSMGYQAMPVSLDKAFNQ